jgi:CheY-like chemotaxis protein
MSAPRILVVEDDDDIRESLQELLQEENYTALPAGNGQQALLQLLSDPLPDLILLDLMMPVMDGWQLQTALKQDPRLASIPVIVISASKFSNESFEAAAFLPKPLDAGVLLEAIENCLGKPGDQARHPIRRARSPSPRKVGQLK